MKRSTSLRSTGRFGAQVTAVLDRDQRVEARAVRMANLAEIVRAAPPAARAVVARMVGPVVAIPKEDANQSGAYMTAAKALGCCMRCGRQVVPLTGQLDFCHADLGKGMGIKTDVRLRWPGCRDCHEEVGRRLARPIRRAVEGMLGRMTRVAVREAGLWPQTLGDWEDRQ